MHEGTARRLARNKLLNRPLVQRFQLDAARRMLHIGFSGLQIAGAGTIAATIEHAVRRRWPRWPSAWR